MRRDSTSTEPRLDVLFCTWNYYPAPAGGAERQARLQAEALVRRGHRVRVICPRTDGLPRHDRINGVEVHRLFRLGYRYVMRLTYFASLTAYLLRHLRRFDLVHVHLANLQADVIVSLSALLRRPAYVKVACGGSVGEVRRLARVARVTRWTGLRRASRVQALSDEIETELVSIGVSSSRIVRIPNGVVSLRVPNGAGEKGRARRRLGLPEDGAVVLFAGRFARYKGVHDLVAVWEQAMYDATLLLVGAPAVDEPGIVPETGRGIVVHDWADDIGPYLAAADVFVYPSYHDGMSNALLEALASGLATVASRSGAAEEMIEDHESGLLFDAGDRPALRTALDEVLADRQLREAMAHGAERSASRYDIEKVVSEIERSYQRMLGIAGD